MRAIHQKGGRKIRWGEIAFTKSVYMFISPVESLPMSLTSLASSALKEYAFSTDVLLHQLKVFLIFYFRRLILLIRTEGSLTARRGTSGKLEYLLQPFGAQGV